jgi:hypothetical protein
MKPPRAAYSLAGLLLVPVAAAGASAAWGVLKTFSWRDPALWPLAAGAASYGVFQWVFDRPLGLYVFGHELTHAAAAVFTGHRVKSLTVSARGGEVRLTGTNVLVALAPYAVPFYTVGVSLVLLLLRRHGMTGPSGAGAFAVGFTFAFHAALTLHALRQNQPDLRAAGVLFSLAAVVAANLLTVVLLLKLLYPSSVSLGAFGKTWGTEIVRYFRWAGEAAWRVGAALGSAAS